MTNANPFGSDVSPIPFPFHKTGSSYATYYAIRLSGPEGSMVLAFTAKKTKSNLIENAQAFGSEISKILDAAGVSDDFEGGITNSSWDLGGGYKIHRTNETLRDLAPTLNLEVA